MEEEGLTGEVEVGDGADLPPPWKWSVTRERRLMARTIHGRRIVGDAWRDGGSGDGSALGVGELRRWRKKGGRE
jgi:hypothetical protein